jgi:hypothetical protein
MQIKTDFENNGQIPSKYTCDGEDLAPILNFIDVPKEAKELVMIMDDPDAPMGTWVHWILYNISPDTKTIDNSNLPSSVKSGFTSFKRTGWGGPCPPNGVHRYFFKLYALNKHIDMPEGLNKEEVMSNIENSIIDYAELIGLYKRI